MIDVKKVAKLARLKVSEEEEKIYQEQLSSILKYFEELAAVNTEGVEPLVTPSDIKLVYRPDVKSAELSVEEAMANAPERMGNLFKVPPVV